MTGCGRIAGVHSTVWIFAISAELISRALSNSCSSVQSGAACASRSQMWLCSSVNSVWSIARPIHQLSVKPLKCDAGLGIDRQQPVGSMLQLAADARPQLRARSSASQP